MVGVDRHAEPRERPARLVDGEGQVGGPELDDLARQATTGEPTVGVVRLRSASTPALGAPSTSEVRTERRFVVDQVDVVEDQHERWAVVEDLEQGGHELLLG